MLLLLKFLNIRPVFHVFAIFLGISLLSLTQATEENKETDIPSNHQNEFSSRDFDSFSMFVKK